MKYVIHPTKSIGYDMVVCPEEEAHSYSVYLVMTGTEIRHCDFCAKESAEQYVQVMTKSRRKVNFQDEIANLREQILVAIEKEVTKRGGRIEFCSKEAFSKGGADMPHLYLIDPRFDPLFVSVMAVVSGRMVETHRLLNDQPVYETWYLDEFISIDDEAKLYHAIIEK